MQAALLKGENCKSCLLFSMTLDVRVTDAHGCPSGTFFSLVYLSEGVGGGKETPIFDFALEETIKLEWRCMHCKDQSVGN